MSPENRSNEAREIAEQYLYDGDSDRPLNAGYDALLALADSVAAVERERDHERRRAESAERRCWAIGHPTVTPASLIPCQLDRGHDGDHWSTSGCSGGEVSWRDAAVAENARLLARIAAVEAPQNVERLCEVMHDAYERAAIGAGWETQRATRKRRRASWPYSLRVRRPTACGWPAALAASPTPTGPEPATEKRERHHRDECPACWSQAHEGHDVGWRHEDGSLYSASCFDCDVTYRRPGPATPESTEETP